MIATNKSSGVGCTLGMALVCKAWETFRTSLLPFPLALSSFIWNMILKLSFIPIQRKVLCFCFRITAH